MEARGDDSDLDAHVAELRSIVGGDHVLVDADLRAGFETDWTRRWTGPCSMVVRPAGAVEVAATLAYCNRNAIDVVTQGGNTGLVGGSVPRRHPSDRAVIVLSTRRLAEVGVADPDAMQITVGAGVTIAQWQDAARRAGLDTPVDFAARESATVGGAIATNAGGSRVLRFGTMRSQVAGVEAVLADGRIVGSLAGLPKETAGLHWPSVIAGSEGTLAVVTAARLRLVPRFEHVTTALVSFDDIDHAVALLRLLRSGSQALDAVEIIAAEALDLVSRHLGTSPPVPTVDGGAVLLVECADHRDPTDDLLAIIASAGGIVGSAIATDAVHREKLVQYRDRITEAINAASTDGHPPYKLDVAVPLESLGTLLSVARAAAARHGARLIPFGHLAEGNLHLNHLGVADGNALADEVLAAVAELGGTISAEHGIGVAKTPWLHLIRNEGDLAAQGAIRSALDPLGILNPGVLDTGRRPDRPTT